MTVVARIRTELRCLVRELGLMNRNCLNSGMTLRQAHILTYLDRNGVTPFFELQTQLGMDKASLSRAITTLSKKGYLNVAQPPSDRRSRSAAILPQGLTALREAETSAHETLDSVLQGFDEEQWIKVSEALKLLRIAALRNNIKTIPQRVQVEPPREQYMEQTMLLLKKIFSREQDIPEHLVPVPDGYLPSFWIIRIGEEVIGVAAAWQDAGQWHWGRFAIDENFRGLRLGKKLARESIAAVFENVTDNIVIEARDITVGIIKKFGGIQTGPSIDFFGEPVTPMLITKENFKPEE